MPWRSFSSRRWRPENRALVVVVTALQLLLIIVVWLLAIVPAGLLALTAMAVRTIKGGAAPGGPDPRP
ncbi:hypothetical protein [Caulobacter sp.]|uniref:hypothetical protein n=1 Tax=Caulobacter sp. TaxID=78 RepID=UPI0025BA6115|nr:hypothetical protein [Caulobacter sp.]